MARIARHRQSPQSPLLHAGASPREDSLRSPERAGSVERLPTAELLGPASPGEHAFRHPLAQEVAYRNQLLERGRGTHAAIARASLTLHGPAATTHTARIAITSMRPAGASRRHAGRSRWAGASHAVTRRMGPDTVVASPRSSPEAACDRTAIESLDALTADLGSVPYRRIAALDRACLAT
jgi:hypothetical protein